MVEQVVQRKDVAGVVRLSPEDYARPASHPGRRVPVAIPVQLVTRDCANEHALVLRAGKDPLGEEIVPGAKAPDILVARRPVIEIEERRSAPLHDRPDQPQCERIRVAADVRPEMFRYLAGYLAERHRTTVRRRPPVRVDVGDEGILWITVEARQPAFASGVRHRVESPD